MLDPSKLVRVLPPTPVVVERVVVNGQDRNPFKIDRLSPGSKNVAFEYTALSLLVPMRITFRYMLEGFDKDWVDAGHAARGVLHESGAWQLPLPGRGA